MGGIAKGGDCPTEDIFKWESSILDPKVKSEMKKFDATKFKEASESCYDALPAKATCNGIIADHFPKAEKCWKMGAAAGGACAPKDIFEWEKGKIDGTLA